MVASASGRVVSPARTIVHAGGAIGLLREQLDSACGPLGSTLGTVSSASGKVISVIGPALVDHADRFPLQTDRSSLQPV
jgi:hypothetical protein